jgi:hypothetical protein
LQSLEDRRVRSSSIFLNFCESFSFFCETFHF